MPNKVFFEITNACNLSCSFCHGTKREIKYLSRDEFISGCEQLRGFADYLYFHLMGEPLLHPLLGEFFDIANELGFRVILTTNGTLLDKKKDILLSAKALHKVSISLHCYEANDMGFSIDDYLKSCFDFCREASDKGIISVMRLWNEGGESSLNQKILDQMHSYFSDQWKEIYSGYKLCEKVFLEWGNKFDWPDSEAEYVGENHSCYGLRDQIGILSDGTIVPCCLDAEGAINLGNIFETDLDEILNSPRAIALKNSFEKRKITEALCQRCGYAKMRYT
ncbi:MAG: SPASM domain-containing protein [Clostridia bacterium]|nr:SPASM domain-containing protein [Clostridia bacterium]